MSVPRVMEQTKVDDSKFRSDAIDACPVCGDNRTEHWLRSRDHLHGRRREYELRRCRACNLVWLAQPPAPNEMHEHYTAAYHKLISGAGDDPSRWNRRRADLLQFKQSGSLLDLGCSSGSFLASMRGDAWSLHGVEMSANEAAAAEARTGGKIFVGSVLDAPFQPESFDAITCFDVLEHIYEPHRVMAKVSYWLKPGGVFYIHVPNIDSAEARMFGSYWHGLELPRHLFHYSPASLQFLAESVGLRPLSLETRRNPAVGVSLRYVWDDVFGAVGIRRTPVAYRTDGGLAWRAARKLVRLTVLRGLLAAAPLIGGGESIHAIFRKEINSGVASVTPHRT